ncbi:MAG: hypothetical protein ACREFR_05000, partial [Limisphaerales bacterium]
MNRFGILLVCIAFGVGLSLTAYGDAPVTPTAPAMPNMKAMHVNTNMMNRIMLMRKRHHLKDSPAAFPPSPGLLAPPAVAPRASVVEPKSAARAVHPTTPVSPIA